jgi:2-polyprenyl-3-methyl-5-hydroxy-6-metoxy-1,4-benzoquinol methylase
MTANVQTNHPSVLTDTFPTIEEYVLYLMHLKTYEYASALAEGRNVLDWGCNNGWGLPILARTAQRVGGLDTNEDRVKEARERYPEYAKNIWLYDGQNIPFTERDWDVVISNQVIEHVPDVASYVKGILSGLSDEGVVLFGTPNREIRLDEGMKPWNEYHVTEFTAEQLSNVLKEHFRYVEVYGLQSEGEIADIERNRCARAREEARKQRTGTQRMFRDIRATVKRATRATLPDTLATGLRDQYRRIRSAPVAPQMSDSVTQRLSTSQLYYTKSDLNTAVDLLAICSNKPIEASS